MKTIACLFIMTACSVTAEQPAVPEDRRQNPDPCSVAQGDDGAVITCPDGTTATIRQPRDGGQGERGSAGAQGVVGPGGPVGAAGDAAAECTATDTDAGARIDCPGSSVVVLDGTKGDRGEIGEAGSDGRTGEVGPVGPSGPMGPAGDPGPPGSDAPVCTVTAVPNGARVDCPDGTSATVASGRDGVDGSAGHDGVAGAPGADSILRIVDPCGPNPAGVDEVLFELSTGTLVAWYYMVGFAVIYDGTWQTTDSQHCVFHVVNGRYVP